MLCALFKSFLLLAIPRKNYLRFAILAVISLSAVQIDSAERGKGMQNCVWTASRRS